MIRGIVFDLWNCLAHDPMHPNPLRFLGEVLGITGQQGWKRRLERGMMLAPAAGIEAGLRQLEAQEGLRVPDAAREEVVERWHASSEEATLFPDVLSVLARLRGNFRLALCSNTQSFGLEFLEREGLWNALDASALSFEVGALKPHPEIFRSVLRRLCLAPDTVLMVGDHRRDDLAGARAHGMWAVGVARQAPESLSHQEPDDSHDDPLVDLEALPERVEAFNRTL